MAMVFYMLVATYVYSRTLLLHAHIMPTSQDFTLGGDKACANGHAAFACAFLGFLESDLEAFVLS